MNYAKYLQDGGLAPQFTEEQATMIKLLQPYAEAFKQNPLAAIQMASEDPNIGINLESDDEIREFVLGLQEYGKLIGDSDLLDDIVKFGLQMLSEGSVPSQKCGGRVRAKVKKACSGKKLEKGSKVPEVKKGGCPCQWKKVGGRLIEVDCNGIPVAKNGAVLKAGLGDRLIQAQRKMDPWFNIVSLYPSLYTKTKDFVYENGMGAFNYGMDKAKDTYELAKDVVSEYYPRVQKAYQAAKNELIAPAQEAAAAELAAAEEEAAVKEKSEPKSNTADQSAAQKVQSNFGAGKSGKFGGLTYDQALARQREMQAAKAQGFNVDLGRWGADGKWGNQSRSEWERYQLWKADQASKASRPKSGANERFVTEGYASGRPWQDAELQNMEPAQAIYLKTPDYDRWMVLNFNSTPTKPFTKLNLPITFKRNGGKMTYSDYLK